MILKMSKGKLSKMTEIVKENGKYNCFAFTVRPNHGVNDMLESSIHKWLRNQPYYAYTIEMDDEKRHIHAIVFFNEPKRKGDLVKQLKRIQEGGDPNWSSAAARVLSQGVKIVYNDDFHTKYMIKDGDYVDSFLPPNTAEYYPTEDEQEKVKSKANAVDKRFHRWAEAFKESVHYCEDSAAEENFILSKLRVADWFADVMYKSKTEQVITDERLLRRNILSLCYYVYGNVNGYHLLCREDQADINTLKKMGQV